MYADAFAANPSDFYTGINATSKAAPLGLGEDVFRPIAEQVAGLSAIRDPDKTDYWALAMVGEAKLLSLDIEGALSAIHALRALVGVGRVGLGLGPRPQWHGARAARSAERRQRQRRRCARARRARFARAARRTARAPVREDLLDHGTVLNAGDDPKRSAAGGAALDIDAEDLSQALCLYALRVQPIAARRVRCSGSLDASECSASTAAAQLV